MTKEFLKQRFSKGKKPTGEDFAILIDTLDASEEILLTQENVEIVHENQSVLNEKVGILENSLKGLKDKVDNPSETGGSGEVLQYDDTILKEQVALIETEISTIKENVANYKDTEMSSKISKLEESVSSINNYKDAELTPKFSELNESIETIRVALLSLANYDDGEIRDGISLLEGAISEIQIAVNNIKEYDDTAISEKITTLEATVSELSNYDDTALATKVTTLETTVSGLSNYDDTEINEKVDGLETNVQSLETTVSNIKPYDDTVINEKVNDLETTVNTLSNYDDTELVTKVTTLESVVGTLENYDDAVMVEKINKLDSDVSKVTLSHTGSTEEMYLLEVTNVQLYRGSYVIYTPYTKRKPQQSEYCNLLLEDGSTKKAIPTGSVIGYGQNSDGTYKSGGFYVEFEDTEYVPNLKGYLGVLVKKVEEENTGSHATGVGTSANGDYSHSEGLGTKALGVGSHSEGENTVAVGDNSHAGGKDSFALGKNSFTSGLGTVAKGDNSTAIGSGSISNGESNFAGGNGYTGVVYKEQVGSVEYQSETGDMFTIKEYNSEGIIVTLPDKLLSMTDVSKLNEVRIGHDGFDFYRFDPMMGAYASVKGNKLPSTLKQFDAVNKTAFLVFDNASNLEYIRSWSDRFPDKSLALNFLVRIPSGKNSFSFGESTGATNDNSTAFGNKTKAIGKNSFSKGSETIAYGENSSAEGFQTVAMGNGSHSEGYNTKAISLTKIDSTVIDRDYFTTSHLLRVGDIGYVIDSDDKPVQVTIEEVGFDENAKLFYKFSPSTKSFVYDFYVESNTGLSKHAEGVQTIALGEASHSEGENTVAIGKGSHSEGIETIAVGKASHVEGWKTKATGLYAHAEGESTKALGDTSHAEGNGTVASADSSHAEGHSTQATGFASHSQNFLNRANADVSHAGGVGNIVNVYGCTAIGSYGNITGSNMASHLATATAFNIGGGTSGTKSNAFRVTFDGKAYGKATYNSTGADYAEYFEWSDGNVEGEERFGLFVTLDGDKIRKATSKDDYILGVISVNPSMVGDSYQDEWANKYLKDKWGRIQYEYVGEDYVQVLNPQWKEDSVYIPREERKEWDAVGMVGKLLVIDDGTCQVNSFCRPNDNGIATKSDSGYRVMKRIDENTVLVLIK